MFSRFCVICIASLFLACFAGCSSGLRGVWEISTMGPEGRLECRSDGSVLERGQNLGSTWRGSSFYIDTEKAQTWRDCSLLYGYKLVLDEV